MFADARQLHELRSLRPAAARCSLPVPSCARVLACRVQLTPAPVPSCIRFAGYRCFSVTTPLTRRQASTLKVRPPHTSGRVSWCASCCSRPGSVRASDERACLCTRTARGARHTAHGTRHTAHSALLGDRPARLSFGELPDGGHARRGERAVSRVRIQWQGALGLLRRRGPDGRFQQTRTAALRGRVPFPPRPALPSPPLLLRQGFPHAEPDAGREMRGTSASFSASTLVDGVRFRVCN